MFNDSRSFLGRPFLQSVFDFDFRTYLDEGRDAAVLAALKEWSGRAKLSETQAESAFIQKFFVELWGYGQSGQGKSDDHSILPKFPVPGAGSGGGKGEADMALGWFRGSADAVPQVLCEFKDIRSNLDLKQNRKGLNLTPVEQCLNYVRGARRNLYGNEPVQPWWGLVTDMNEFRLYWWDRVPQHVKFTIRGKEGDLFERRDLLSVDSDSQFDRFLFCKLFHRDMLISESGRPSLWRLVERQWRRESQIEEEFYSHYKGVRERLFNVLRLSNPKFTGSATDLLRVSQKLLDRFIFAFYCEDMGERMLFPPQFIRDYLKTRCNEPYYEVEGGEIWDFFRRFFNKMNTGGTLGKETVPYINGGLFADDPLIDSLSIPNHIFAAHGQGANDASLEKDKETLFYLSARYNYAAKGDAKESLTLYTLGRIFEQSITELEYRVGELENRETVAKLSKRKRDGVYYTPEWVVNYLVEETMGPWFAKARADCGYPEEGAPALEQVNAYLDRVRAIRVVDPACGSGAFLISAFRRLLDERKSIAKHLAELTSKTSNLTGEQEASLVADILKNNIYGVDINPSSVEIAKLALWLHSARAKSPLSSLDGTIRCGNSLVASDYWLAFKKDDEREARINPFDWDEAFPFKFDIVLGNPPYVKLQNLMKVDADVVAYLQAPRAAGTYASAQTGNFDLYLPFIEKGLDLLAPGGRMAYIAPSLWAVNEYGAGLRKLIHRTGQLERWIDFKSFQVFEEAITYTALQFFTKEPNESVRIAISPDGEIGDVDWKDKALAVAGTELRPDAEWLMATGEERGVVEGLRKRLPSLGDARFTHAIYQGLVTSADPIYHLRRLGTGKYECSGLAAASFVVEIEEALMKPLISGPQAKRYESPEAGTHLLFPYFKNPQGNFALGTSSFLLANYPKAWSYLKRFETELRARENSKMNIDEGWWGYVYPKNLAFHDHKKLIVAQTVPSLRVSADLDGDKYLNNVRVNGILPAKGCDLSYILGVLNGSVADYVFRRIGKPKQGGWFEANKQFIAPLPIPEADEKTQKEIGARAKELQESWTLRRELVKEAGDRLSTLPRAAWKARFLWPDLPDIGDLKNQAPKRLDSHEKLAWAKERLAELEAKHIEGLQGHLNSREEMEAQFSDGELRLTCGGALVLGKIYLDAGQGKLAEVYWRNLFLARQKDAKAFARDLGRIPNAPDTPAARQFVEKVTALENLTKALSRMEREMNEALYVLYKLTDHEREIIEKDCAVRSVI
jgi:Eco57I restriction-modification methylase